MTHIDHVPAQFYALGEDAIDVAINAAETHIRVRDEVRAGRLFNPESFPVYGSDDPNRIAARIIGDLLGAGWRPPSDDDVKAAVDDQVASAERYNAWFTGLTNRQRNYAMGYFATHGEFPDDCRPPKGEAS